MKTAEQKSDQLSELCKACGGYGRIVVVCGSSKFVRSNNLYLLCKECQGTGILKNGEITQ